MGRPAETTVCEPAALLGTDLVMNRSSLACILAQLAIRTLATASQAEPHAVLIPLKRHALLNDSLIWATVVHVCDGDTVEVN